MDDPGSLPSGEPTSRGVVYVAFGERHLDEARQAAHSLRVHMPDVPVALASDVHLVDEMFDHVLVVETVVPDAFAELVGRDDPAELQRHFYNKILALERTPFEHTVFLDTDTRTCTSLRELFLVLESADVAAAHTPTRVTRTPDDAAWFLPTHNTGVLAYRKNADFFGEWRRLFVERYHEGDFSDQAVFDEALARTRIRVSSLPEEFNYRVSALAKLHGRVKVLHGRDHERLAATEGFVNATERPRLVIPEVGLIWIEDGQYRFLSYDDQESGPITLRRQQLLLRLSHLL